GLFNDVRGGGRSGPKRIVIKNGGTAPLAITSDGLTIIGEDEPQFDIVSSPTLPMTLAVGQSISVSVAFNPLDTTRPGIKTAALQIRSSDPNRPTTTVQLRGLATT